MVVEPVEAVYGIATVQLVDVAVTTLAAWPPTVAPVEAAGRLAPLIVTSEPGANPPCEEAALTTAVMVGVPPVEPPVAATPEKIAMKASPIVSVGVSELCPPNVFCAALEVTGRFVEVEAPATTILAWPSTATLVIASLELPP